MASSWSECVSSCKSRLSAIARSSFLARQRWFEKSQQAKQLLDEAQAEIAAFQSGRARLEDKIAKLQGRIAVLEAELAQPRFVKWPLGEVPPGQQFEAGLITVCVNLAREMGLRPVERVLRIFSRWMKVEVRIPTYQAIRGWMQRIGLDRMTHAKKKANGVWIVDHTNQIGKEKVLMVLRVRGSALLRPGVPLRHRDVEVLTLTPGTEWKRENVADVYRETESRFGVPRAVETDGAVELREPAETLGKPGAKAIVIRDPKHFLANRLEALLTKDPQYQAFAQKLGWARSALQQTELAHFIPPGIKPKSRFMNLAPTLKWATTMLWHLNHPESQSRIGISASRMEEKMGWLRSFARSIQTWQECQQVISNSLTYLSRQGIVQGAAERLQKLLATVPHSPNSRKLAAEIVEFTREHENKLRPQERLPMSTEIIESSFSRYKHFEKQHSKNGFSSLLLTFPTLLRKTTPKEVTESFARVRIADVNAWTTTHMPNTLASKRQLVFPEFSTTTKRNTENGATPLLAAV